MRKEVKDEVEKINNVKNIHLYTQNHRTADNRTAYHANYASDRDENESKAVCIVADDTDIFIILCSIAHYCQSVLYFRQGTSSIKTGITYPSVSTLASELGEVLCEVLPSSMLSMDLISQDLFIVAHIYKASKNIISAINNKINIFFIFQESYH